MEPGRWHVARFPSENGCAGHGGLVDHGAEALRRGIDVITLSLGALADDRLALALDAAARDGGATLHMATGAIGALDALRAAREGGNLTVRYTGRKPPTGWQGAPAADTLDLINLHEATAHFTGTAGDAARLITAQGV